MTDLAIKNIKMFLPPGEMQDEWLRGIEACKGTGISFLSDIFFQLFK